MQFANSSQFRRTTCEVNDGSSADCAGAFYEMRTFIAIDALVHVTRVLLSSDGVDVDLDITSGIQP